MSNLVHSNIINFLKTNGFNNISEQNFNKDDLDFIVYAINDENISKQYQIHEKRTKQQIFRNQLIDRYGKCIVTGNHEKRCEACHIIPFSECNQFCEYDTDNGILLDAGLHKLFDNYMLSINPQTMHVVISKVYLDSDPNLKKYNEIEVNIDQKSINYIKKHYANYCDKNKIY